MPSKKEEKDPDFLPDDTNNPNNNTNNMRLVSILPTRCPKTNRILFTDHPQFNPNLSPDQVLRLGSFGGGYYRDLNSKVTKKRYKKTWKDLPKEWLEGVDVGRMIASPIYNKQVNNFGVDCGAKADKKTDPFGLTYWEQSDWIRGQDPYGWFQWYCRFYQGRRSPDDDRQISRWCKFAGPTGRFRNNLITKVANAQTTHDDRKVSPVVRQSLQHWGYELTEDDYLKGMKKRIGKGKTEKKVKKEVKMGEEEDRKRKREASASGRAERAAKRRNVKVE